jgi:YD repeat-containing protein
VIYPSALEGKCVLKTKIAAWTHLFAPMQVSAGYAGVVMKRVSVSLFLLVALQLFTCLDVFAQSGNSCQSLAIWYWPDPVPSGWQCTLPGQGPYSMLCIVPSGNCPPLVWCPQCGQFVPVGGAPINLTNGNTYIREKDIAIPGIGGGLALERNWNSIWPASEPTSAVGMFGPNWRSTFEERISAGSGSATGYDVYSRSDGGLWYFGGSGSTLTLAAPANTTATLTSGSSYWTLTFQNGEQRRFDNASGSLITIIDRNGNATQLTYNGSHQLTTITDPASRTLTFTYGTSCSPAVVTGVSASVGPALSYSYDTSCRLTQVTKPDFTTMSFTYNTLSLITSVKDNSGIVLESHTYDSSGRGLTSSRAGGVEAVTISYP